jgi:hypothetical protein
MALEIRRQDRFALGHMKRKKRIRVPTGFIITPNKKTKLRIMQNHYELKAEAEELRRVGTNVFTNTDEMVETICDRKLDDNNIIQINATLDKVKRNALPSPQQGSCSDDKAA